jgi:hypothetical protein
VDRFAGSIAGVGTTSGVSVVVGSWHDSPFGRFADAMISEESGHRVLVAPRSDVAEYVAATYGFDDVLVAPVEITEDPGRWTLTAGPLALGLTIGSRRLLGWLLRAVPRPIATSTRFATAVDPIARVVLRGVRTRGSAGNGRTEWYSATDCRAITAASGHWRGADLGRLAPVDPPVRFGFASTPRTPSVTAVTTTIRHPSRRPQA